MSNLSTPEKALYERICEFPVSKSHSRGLQEFEALKQRAAPELTQLLHHEPLAKLFQGLFDGSPYLTTGLLRDEARLLRLVSATPEDSAAHLFQRLETEAAAAATVPEIKSALRRYKSELALITGLADLGGVWDVMTVTRVLSEAADVTLSAAVRFLFKQAAHKGQWLPRNAERPEEGSGYIVLAMGKHGAFELNYSSDIDFIVFFNRDRATPAASIELQPFLVRLTRDLVQLMEERTADGYVFRTDLRLRPDAGATQLAISTDAAHDYYESVGQNWERAALIKARPAAGDLAAGRQFLDELSPFIWRKNLDYAAIADIHAMKRQIHAHKGFEEIAIAGHDLKLGRGGIREIEFFAQTQQLIAGGRQIDVRVAPTLDALKALEARGWIKPGVTADLTRAYLFLRRLEHRAQMIADEQTHAVPDEPAALQRFVQFSGYSDIEAFSSDLTAALQTVRRHYAVLFKDDPELTRSGSNMVFAGSVDDPDTVEALRKLGYSQPSQVLATVRSWHHGRTPAVRSARARELLTEVQPLLIEALGKTADPDGAIASFDRFLAELPAGVQLFSLLKANPELMQLIADIMGTAPRLARILSRRRRLLDAVLDPRTLGDVVSAEDLDNLIAREFDAARNTAGGVQDILDRARIIGSEQSFLVGVRVLSDRIRAADAGGAYATIAERLIAGLLAETERELEAAHGKVPGGRAVVLAMGKLGGREMTASSDLDLIVVYDFDPEADESDGPKPLAPTQYYSRLTQRLVTALSAQTPEGALYDVDLRLRPSGQKGPVATQFRTFKSYQLSEAWTWEHMALTRGRVVAGSPALAGDLNSIIRDVLSAPRDREKIATDVRDMRQRIASEKGTADIWDLKQVSGGLVDLEFIAQYLQLVWGSKHPGVFDQNTLGALSKLEKAGCLNTNDAADLIAAGHLLHDLTQIVRLCIDGQFKVETAPDGLKNRLVRVSGTTDFSDLETKLKGVQRTVHEAFDRLVV